jgi:putative hydrolase of the HAD superfamily
MLMVHLFEKPKFHMKKYQYLFFDLDRTLWDFDANSRETLSELYVKYKLSDYYESFDQFYNFYHKNNDHLWDQYRNGLLKKEVLRSLRFFNTLEEVGIKNQKLAYHIGNDYVDISPTKKNVFPFTYEALDYLKANNYNLYIITNGFNEVQFIKMQNCNLLQYFKRTITAENAGSHKPNPEIFHYALSSVHAVKEKSIMVGDDLEVDIIGAKKSGIDQVYFNSEKLVHTEQVTFEIESLKELMDIF